MKCSLTAEKGRSPFYVCLLRGIYRRQNRGIYFSPCKQSFLSCLEFCWMRESDFCLYPFLCVTSVMCQLRFRFENLFASVSFPWIRCTGQPKIVFNKLIPQGKCWLIFFYINIKHVPCRNTGNKNLVGP